MFPRIPLSTRCYPFSPPFYPKVEWERLYILPSISGKSWVCTKVHVPTGPPSTYGRSKEDSRRVKLSTLFSQATKIAVQVKSLRTKKKTLVALSLKRCHTWRPSDGHKTTQTSLPMEMLVSKYIPSKVVWTRVLSKIQLEIADKADSKLQYICIKPQFLRLLAVIWLIT